MTPKQVRDEVASILVGQTDAGMEVYSGRYLPHIMREFFDYNDKKIIDVNVPTRDYENFHPREVQAIGEFTVNIECAVWVSENVMDEVDNLMAQVITSLFSNSSFINNQVNIGGWTESIAINTDMEKEFAIGLIELTVSQQC